MSSTSYRTEFCSDNVLVLCFSLCTPLRRSNGLDTRSRNGSSECTQKRGFAIHFCCSCYLWGGNSVDVLGRSAWARQRESASRLKLPPPTSKRRRGRLTSDMTHSMFSYLLVCSILAWALAHECIHDQLTSSMADFLATRPDIPQLYAPAKRPTNRRLTSQVGSLRFKPDFSRVETSRWVRRFEFADQKPR